MKVDEEEQPAPEPKPTVEPKLEEMLLNSTGPKGEADPDLAYTPDNPKPSPAPDYASVVAKFKTESDNAMAKLKADYEQQLQERDSVIAQLISGQPIEKPPVSTRSFIDYINEKRTYKKW